MLQQHSAQPLAGSIGHATRAGHTSQQPERFGSYDFSATGGDGFPQPPKFDDKLVEREFLKGRLAAAFRIFAQRGFDEGVAGHITVRDPVEPDTFWVNPFGVPFAQMRRSDLVRINHVGEVVDGGSVRLINRAAVMIHAAGRFFLFVPFGEDERGSKEHRLRLNSLFL
jgi:hypothetical protein